MEHNAVLYALSHIFLLHFQVWSIKTPRSTRSAIIKDPRQKHVKKIWLTAQSEVPLAKVITLRAYRQTLVDQKTRQDETENRQ